MTHNDPTHEDFIRCGKLGELAEQFFAAYLRSRGHRARALPKQYAPTRAQRRDFKDQGDVEAYLNDQTWPTLFDVKCIRHQFTDRHWPFDRYIVCKVKEWKEAETHPDQIVTLDPSWTYGAIVDVFLTEPYWKPWTGRYAKPGRPERVEEYLLCPIERVVAFNLRETWGNLAPPEDPRSHKSTVQSLRSTALGDTGEA